MINRTYICRMPNVAGGSVNLDIAVQNAPGTRSAPVGSGGVAAAAAVGAYYEWRGRPLRFPNPSTPAASFVPRARLGWNVSVYQYGAVQANSPGVILSASIISSLVSTEGGGPIISPTLLADPAYGPTIRLINAAALADLIYIVHFNIMEQDDEDGARGGV